MFAAALAAVVSLSLVAVAAAPAQAQPIGGGQLDRTQRTVDPLPGADPLPDVWAETWLIADATTGEVLAHKGAHVQRYPASCLKTLTALTVLPRTSPDDVYVATKRAATIYGSRVGLRVGKPYTLDQLWYAVFLPSANDAAVAVAEANGGVRKTVRQMNRLARQLQANDTVARNTSGLDAPGQRSSAYDLALFARAGLQREDFSRYAGTVKAPFPNVVGRGTHPIYTTNRLLMHGYKGMIGVKTGFTSLAGRTYIGAARRGDTTLIVTLMGIHESSEDAARKLLDWGFANDDKVRPVGVLVDPLPDEPAADATPSAAASPGSPTPTPAGEPPSPSGTAVTSSASGTDLPQASGPVAEPVSRGVSTAAIWGVGIVVAAALATALVTLVTRRRRRQV